MTYRCKATFEGSFLSARNLPHRHVLEFNAGASAVLVDQELPPEEVGWTQAHQTEAFEAMHALKVATTSVLNAISFATGVGSNTGRHHLLEEDVPLAGEMLSSSILHVLSYAPASPADAKDITTGDEHVDAGLLTAVYCPTPGLEVQVPPRPDRPFRVYKPGPYPPGQWVGVPFGHNTIVVMAGSTLEHATAGVLRACVHRVRPSSGTPCRTSLAFKLRARIIATLPRGLLLINSSAQRQEDGVDGADTISSLMQTFRQTHGPPLNGAQMMSAPVEKEQVRRRMEAERQDCRRRAGIEDCSVQLFVKNIDGKTLTLECETLLWTLLEFKRRVQQKTRISVPEMRLIFSGKHLDDDYGTLADYNVQRESTIHLCLRLRGD